MVTQFEMTEQKKKVPEEVTAIEWGIFLLRLASIDNVDRIDKESGLRRDREDAANLKNVTRDVKTRVSGGCKDAKSTGLLCHI